MAVKLTSLYRSLLMGALTTGSLLTLAAGAEAATLRITVDNLAPSGGTALTPTWFGFHDGNFDLYDRGQPVSAALERLAEDGTIDPINAAFEASGAGSVQGAIVGPAETPGPIDAGESTSFTVDLDGSAASSRYFSYAAMVLPSNDFFIANGNPLAQQIFDDAGNFLGADFTVAGSQVLDAGSEVNDEIAANTAFFGQQAPDTGVVEGGTVELAGGFIPGGPILSSADFRNADFTVDGYDVARFRVELVDDATDVPEPGVVLGLLAVGGVMAVGRRQRRMA